ncbi:MAG: histidine phosphatase family protein [Pseudomonadota bacterium]
MQRLILMRHAKTEAWAEGVDDHGRALTQSGHNAAAAMAAAIVAEGWQPQTALISTARRTRETWHYISKALPDCDSLITEDLYLAGERGIADLIADHDGNHTTMVIGHNPGLHDLALSVLREAGSQDHQAAMRLAGKLPTGAVALFEAAEDGAFVPALLRLKRFMRPKDLVA